MKKILIYIFIALSFIGTPQVQAATDAAQTNTASSSVDLTPLKQAYTPGITDTCPKGEYCLLEPLPDLGVSQNSDCVSGNQLTCISFRTFVEYIFKFMIALSVFLATIMIIYGGFQWMLSEVPYIKVDAKGKITNAVMGLAIALGSYLILQTIDPRLVDINTQIQPICSPGDKTNPKSVCYAGGFNDFNNTYLNSLKQFSAQQQLEAAQLRSQKTDIQNQKADLQTKLANKEITQDQFDTQNKALDIQNASVNTKTTQLSSSRVGLDAYQEAFSILTTDPDNLPGNDVMLKYIKPVSAASDTLVDGKFPVDPDENYIQLKYNQKINDLLAIQPQTDETNVAIRTLVIQKKFYVNQIQEDYQTQAQIFTNRNVTDSVNILTPLVKKYEAQLNDPILEKQSGVPADQYAQIYQARIDRINKYIANPQLQAESSK